ncbi:hypothetical protein [Leptospira alstonii]|uniref:hypothetical protein n=1 Tax=Leptospira alstonii TaxID=28452 RepID=UPI0007739228|nr:hypothetical protein [Leptospira alstonii]
MKEKSIYSYYRFGYNYHILKVSLENKPIKTVVKRVSAYLEEINILSLPVTSQIVVRPLNRIVSKLTQLDQESILDQETATEIQKIIDQADPALDSELQLKKVYILTSKRFEVSILLEDSQSLLAQNVWDKLTDNAKNDYIFASKCIALNLATSSAFHIMRSVEEMVKQLYFHYVKQNRMEKPMWGPMIDKLRSKKQPKPNQHLLDHLDNIRKNYRNPTQHPEKFYDIDEAQDLLHTSIVALNEIGKLIGKNK